MKVIYYLHPLEVLVEQNMTKHNTQPDEVAGPILSLDDVEVLSVCLSQGKWLRKAMTVNSDFGQQL